MPTDVVLLDMEPPLPKGGVVKRLTRWLIVLALGLVVAALVLVSAVVTEMNAGMQAELASLQATLAGEPPRLPEIDQLNSELIQLQTDNQALNSLQATLQASHIHWPDTMHFIADIVPFEMNLTTISDTPGGLVINGEALSEAVVLDYADRLRRPGRFDPVVVQSITLKPFTASRTGGTYALALSAGDTYAEFVLTLQIGDAQ